MILKSKKGFLVVNSEEYIIKTEENKWQLDNYVLEDTLCFITGNIHCEVYTLNNEIFFLEKPSIYNQIDTPKYKWYHLTREMIEQKLNWDLTEITPLEIDWDFELYHKLSLSLLDESSYEKPYYHYYVLYNQPVFDIEMENGIKHNDYLIIPISISGHQNSETFGNNKKGCYEQKENKDNITIAEFLAFKTHEYIGKIKVDSKLAKQIYFGKALNINEILLNSYNFQKPFKQSNVILKKGVRYVDEGRYKYKTNLKENIIQSIEKDMVTVKKGIVVLGNPNDHEFESREKEMTYEFDYDFEINKFLLSYGTIKDIYDLGYTFYNFEELSDYFETMPENSYQFPFHNNETILPSRFRMLCNYLSLMAGLQPVYRLCKDETFFLNSQGYYTTDPACIEGYRFPTIAEWEYAANGGHLNKEIFLYSGSNDPEEVGWFNTNASEPQLMGLKKPNQLGLYDMSGNISELTLGKWHETDHVFPENTKILKNFTNFNLDYSDEEKIFKGGGINTDPQLNYSRSITCNNNFWFGLRLARTTAPIKKPFRVFNNYNKICWQFLPDSFGHDVSFYLYDNEIAYKIGNDIYFLDKDRKVLEELKNFQYDGNKGRKSLDDDSYLTIFKTQDNLYVYSYYRKTGFYIDNKINIKSEAQQFEIFAELPNGNLVAEKDYITYIVDQDFNIIETLEQSLKTYGINNQLLGMDFNGFLFIKKNGIITILNTETGECSNSFSTGFKNLFAIDIDNTKYFLDKEQKLISFDTTTLLGKRFKVISSSIDYDFACAIDENNDLYCWGNESHNRAENKPDGLKWKDVNCGPNIVAGIDTNDDLYIWGRDDYGQCSNKPTGLKWKSVSCGLYHAGGIDTNDDLYVWGQDNYGQCSNKPTGLKWKYINCGRYYTAGIDTNDDLYVWGQDNYGQCSNKPTGLKWKSVSCDSFTTVAIDTNDDLYVWGQDNYGQCSNKPTGLKWKQVVSISTSIIALDTDNQVHSWGSPYNLRTQMIHNNLKMKFIDKNFGITENDYLFFWGTDSNRLFSDQPLEDINSNNIIADFGDMYLYPYSNLVIDVYGNLYFAYQDINLDNILVSYTNTGEKRWETILHPNNEAIEIHDILIAENETLFVFTNHGTIFNLDLNGNIIDRIEFANPYKIDFSYSNFNPPLGYSYHMKLDDDGMLYVSRPYEGLYAIQTNTKGLMKDCWACRKQNNDETGYYR